MSSAEDKTCDLVWKEYFFLRLLKADIIQRNFPAILVFISS